MNSALFLLTALIWGTTWIGIKYQLGEVHPLWSLTYRFGVSSIILIIVCLLKGKSLSFSWRQQGWIILQAFFLFCVNYLLCYYGTGYFVSGIVAVLFASVTIMNIINSRIFLKVPISSAALIGATVGISGLVCIFSTEVIRIYQQGFSFIITGLSFCLGGALCASFGQTVAAGNIKRSMPIMQTNALGMAYGAIMTAIAALIIGAELNVNMTFGYLSSLFYLSLFGTVLAFGAYLTLIGNIGAGRASYTFVLTPLIALLVSSMVEEFDWDIYSFVGCVMVFVGNMIVLTPPRVFIRIYQAFKHSF